ncbi:MAG: ankyrin repeat domain-containing protein [Endozoicomonadaceae bacterium]|nr:ankyrin repeat domain-containing protein [Endozoicomonadaceae bacterium]
MGNGADVNNRAESDVTPLHLAALQNDVKVIELLIENGADIEFDKVELTPLVLAVKTGKLKAANCLLKAGANVNVRNDQDETPLMLAVLSNDVEMVQCLIDNKADVNAQYVYGDCKESILSIALKVKVSDKIIKKLISKGASR